MVTADFKQYSNEDVIDIINDFKDGKEECDLGELKNLLAEVTNRKLGAQYADAVSSLIHSKVAVPSSAEKPKRERKEKAKPPEREKYPVLRFMSSLFKVMAWVLFTVVTVLGCGISYVYFMENPFIAVLVVFAGIALGTVCFLTLYYGAEKIHITMEIERHLRDIKDNK